AGNILISHDGTFVLYTMARGTPPTKYSPPEQYSLVLVDTGRQQQRIVATQIPINMQPFAFTNDNDAVMLVGIDKVGTYKLSLKDGTLTQISAYSYLGTISG